MTDGPEMQEPDEAVAEWMVASITDRWRHPDLQFGPDPDEKSIQQLVMEDIAEREQIGIQRYGTAIYASSTPDDPVEGGPEWQAYREALDLVIYLRWNLERRKRYGSA